jgi:hypothetical protein
VTFQSQPGQGTTVNLDLPAGAPPSPAPGAAPGAPRRRTASVSLDNPRTAAIVTTLLRSAGFEVTKARPTAPGDSLLWITAPTEGLAPVRRFLNGDLDRRAIVVGRVEGEDSGARLTFVEQGEDLEGSSELEALREALRATVRDLVETTDVF